MEDILTHNVYLTHENLVDLKFREIFCRFTNYDTDKANLM